MKFEPLSLLIITLFFESGSTAQLSSPIDSVNSVSEILGEKVWLHSDRSIYNTGEDVWFKAYVVDVLTNKPSPVTNNLHIDLISPALKIISHRIVRIEKGLGKGDFFLADSLPSGSYYIRAYTNYMRNFSDELFFRKEITVINPANKSNIPGDSVKFVQSNLFLNFFPEGGSLVDNISSIVAFKATDALGKGCNVKGKIISSEGELITTFESIHLGMGFFKLKPIPGLTYFALVQGISGPEYRAEIPTSFPSGVTLHASVIEGNKLLVKVEINDQAFPLLNGKDLQLYLASRNLISASVSFKISSVVNHISLPLTDFPEGVLKLTLTLPDGLSVSERLLFYSKNSGIKIQLSTDKESYTPREQVIIALKLNAGTTGTFEKAFLSLSAADSRMTGNTGEFHTSIASWFLLENEVRGTVEQPSFYFDLSREDRLQKLDLLLLTQGWRDFLWKYDTASGFKHEIGFPVSGKVTKNIYNKPYPGAMINLGIFNDKDYTFQKAESDSEGLFRVDNLDIKGKARVIASSADRKERFTGWIFLDSLYYTPPDFNIPVQEKLSLLPDQYRDLITEAREIKLTRKKYKLSDTLMIGEVIVTARKHETAQEARISSGRSRYGTPDNGLVVTPKMMLTYPDVYRLIQGNIPGVEVYADGISYTITIRGEAPLLLRDGIPLHSPDELMHISVSSIDRIDVKYWASTFGKEGGNGVINVITRSGDMNNEIPNLAYSKDITVKGFDIPRVFYSPVYATPESAGLTPDFRNTVHWDPDLIVEGNKEISVKFYNTDKPAVIEVEAEGITESGIPLTGSLRYEVK